MKKRKTQMLPSYATFINKLVLDDRIYFESELIKLLIPKYIKFDNVVFYKTPRFMEVKDITLHIERKIFNENKIYKRNHPNSILIEPIFIQNPNILEMYYKKKNIKCKIINENISLPKTHETQTILTHQESNILKERLQYQEDEIEVIY